MEYGIKANANFENIINSENIRISVISDNILRVEKDDNKEFCNEQTQLVLNRDFGKIDFQVFETKRDIKIITKSNIFLINKSNLKTCLLKDNKKIYPSLKTNLGGTARTLDMTNGNVLTWKNGNEGDSLLFHHFKRGIFSKNGIALIDDSKSSLILKDKIIPRRKNIKDFYYLAFSDYLLGLKEYYKLTGFTPLLPKFVFGNWWSRYYPYTQAEYLNLMQKFKDLEVPFTVSVIDMDWHIVDDVPSDIKKNKFSSSKGWTGYTWNTKLFPNYVDFLEKLHQMNLKITLNLHPADGVRYFEKQYSEFSNFMGLDPSKKEQISFNLMDDKFKEAYFKILHEPYEKDGVDFWWIDWQQGTKSKTNNLDPLWLLNHYHYINSKNNLILSRYAGLGSHRYPIGFSGDTFVSWKSLKFQPYFTSLASNAGYTWWSHDIGGHLGNYKNDPVLYLRWIQFGCFSPISRLHSSKESISKEPWNHKEVEKEAIKFLQLRHRLIPYLYNANIKTNEEGVPLICPLYYYDKSIGAYSKKYRNEYFFGEQMLVCPTTNKTGIQKIYLPEGTYYNFFTNTKQESGIVTINTPLNEYPVFCKGGAIIPLLDSKYTNKTDYNTLHVKIYKGENHYVLKDVSGYISFTTIKEKNKYIVNIDNQNKQTKAIKIEAIDFVPSINLTGLNTQIIII